MCVTIEEKINNTSSNIDLLASHNSTGVITQWVDSSGHGGTGQHIVDLLESGLLECVELGSIDSMTVDRHETSRCGHCIRENR